MCASTVLRRHPLSMLRWLMISTLSTCDVSALKPTHSPTTRRALLASGAATIAASSKPAVAADAYGELMSRLQAPIVSEAGDSGSGGKEPALPGWLAGRWQCEQTLTSFTLPLGVQYIGAPGRPLAEAEASAAQTRAQIGKPVMLELRFAPTETGGVVQDWAFNARSRLDAFAGRPVTSASSSCAEAGVDSANGIACSFIKFRGPVSQKQIVNSERVAQAPSGTPSSVVISEFTRSIFARLTVPGDTRSFPPITTDSETVVRLAPDADNSNVVRGSLRLISYLQPYDPLYFAAGRKSVSISDYSLTLTKLVVAAPPPGGGGDAQEAPPSSDEKADPSAAPAA